LATKGTHPNILKEESLGITKPIIEKDVDDGLEVEISNKYQNFNKIKILQNNIFYCACLDLDKIISTF
jgi:hypothetical protein